MKTIFTSARYALLLAGSALLSTHAVHGQSFVPATTQEKYIVGSPTSGVKNTGTGLCTDGSSILHVSTWDGTVPSFGWSLSGAAPKFQKLDGVSLGYTVSDPDIVAYYGGGNWYMSAVYLARSGSGANTVRYEVQKYTPATNSWSVVTSSTRIDNGTTAPCNSPNVDINRRTGDAVFVFEQTGNIYARTRNFLAGAATGLRRVACNNAVSGTTYTHRDPDVAVYGDIFSTGGPDEVSITYVTQITAGTSSTLQVDLLQDLLTTIQAPSSACTPYPTTTQIAFGPVPSSHILELPRIAASQFSHPTAGAQDCIIAVRYNDTFGDQIYTLARWDAAYGSAISVQQQNTLTASQPNVRPVVTYDGDGVLLAWQYDDAGAGNTSNTIDILGEWLNLGGIPTTGDLLVANQNLGGTQAVPSLEARGYSLTVTSTGYGVWYDDAKQDIAYKPVQWNSSSLRSAAVGAADPTKVPSTQLSVYPNPALGSSRVQVHLSAQETAQTLQVVESRSGKVVATLPIEQVKTGATTDLNLPALQPGLYVLRLTTDKGARITRFSYQP